LSSLKLEVLNSNNFHKSDCLGKLTIDITQLPANEAVRKREALKEGQGDIEVEVIWQPGKIAAKPELTYFDGPGRGELTRATLRAGGVPFTDTRVKQEQWPKLKGNPNSVPARCFGSMPVLAHGDHLVAQSIAIAQYAADLGIYTKRPPTSKERALDMMVLGAHADLQQAMYACLFGNDESKAAAKEALPDKVAPILVGLERIYDGPVAFLYTSEAEGPMLGDLAVHDAFNSHFPGLKALGVDLNPYVRLQACVSAVEAFQAKSSASV